MNIGYLNVERRIAPPRASVLRKLGISNLVSTAKFFRHIVWLWRIPAFQPQ